MGWDCETQGERLVAFCASGADDTGVAIWNPAGLQTAAVFDFMLQVAAARPRALHVGFFFDYDVMQLVRQLPPAHLHQLRRKGSVYWRGWKIRHIPGKKFQVVHCPTGRRITIWDVSGWANCSFARLCEDWGLGTKEEREIICSMKAQRSQFDQLPLAQIIEYSKLECRLLAQWARRIIDLHGDVGIRLRAYSGAGATAAAIFRRYGWRPPAVPDPVQAVAEQAFYGGRSETSCIGPVPGTVHGYDIRSAYPAEIARLPEIRGARWRHVQRYVEGAWGFYRIAWQQPRNTTWGLFPARGARMPTGRRSLSLLYATRGEGWYHSSEVEAALAVAPRSVHVYEGWIIEAGAQGKLVFPWVLDLAAERLRRKSAGDPAEYPLKLGLNSLYGKLAQHSGTHPLQCIVYASAITAAVRARLLRAAVPAGHDVILLATDGVLARRPLPELEIGSELGEWEYATYEGAWIAQAGVYWAGAKIRTRGVDGRALSLDQIMELYAKRGINAEVPVTVSRVISYRQACARGRPELTGAWEHTQRIVSLRPEPRRRPWRYDEHGAMLTMPADPGAYRQQVVLDEIYLDLAGETLEQHDLEGIPEWLLD
jgi:hypothetical protein